MNRSDQGGVTLPLRVFNGASAPAVQPIDWLIRQLLARGAGTILFGQPGVSKTAHALVLCACLSRGLPFAGFDTGAGGLRILYVDFDKGWNWSSELIQAAFRGVGCEGLPDDFWYFSPLTAECQEPSIDTNLEYIGQRIAETVSVLAIDLVVVDSLGMGMAGDPNNQQDVSMALREGLDAARANNAAVLVLDHAAKSAAEMTTRVPTPIGAQSKRAWAVVTVALEREEMGLTRWSVDKTNAREFLPFVTRLNFENNLTTQQLETLTLERVGEAGDRVKASGLGGNAAAQQMILEQLSSGEKRRKEFGRGGTIDRALEELIASSTVVKPAHGIYRLADVSAAPHHRPLAFDGVVQEDETSPTSITKTTPLFADSKLASETAMVISPNL